MDALNTLPDGPHAAHWPPGVPATLDETLANKIIDAEHPVADWNIYVLHFSDGDNWGDDVPKCKELLANTLLPKLNLFGYGQVESPYGSGEFFDHVHELVGDQAVMLPGAYSATFQLNSWPCTTTTTSASSAGTKRR